MSECCLNESLVIHSAPTLAGIKTGNLFAVPQKFDQSLRDSITEFNSKAIKKNLRLVPIKAQTERTLLYVYRPRFLDNDFKCEKCRCFLKDLGYPVPETSACVKEYISRLSESSEFLHEIGFFLGYPSEDVIAFIERGPKEAKCNMGWCVYSDVCCAKRKAEAYRICSKIYYENWSNGKSIDNLIVTT